jgi:hypothetical protein
MNGRIPIIVGIAILIVSLITIYLEQDKSKITTVNISTTNVTQSSTQAPTSITVTTDKSSYSMGDAVLISGTAKSPVAGTPVFILILDPNNLLLQTGRILVSPDGSFATTIMTTASIWKLGGTYTVSAQYGTSDVKARTTFYFVT